MEHLTGDLVGLLDAYKIKDAVFVGHDWGGLVVWQLPLFHASRVRGIVGVNTPFLARAPMDPIAGMRMMFGEDMYIVYFQKPGAADAILAKDVGKTFRFFMRKTGMKAADYAKLPQEARNLALVKALETDEAGLGRHAAPERRGDEILRRHLHPHRFTGASTGTATSPATGKRARASRRR